MFPGFTDGHAHLDGIGWRELTLNLEGSAAVAEAMARGLKFFGADLGGIKEIAAGIPGAELHSDFAALKCGIAAWLKAGAPRQPDAARQIAERYHPKIIAARHMEIYREVLGRIEVGTAH